MRNLFLGLAMMLTATLGGWGGVVPAYADHAVVVGDISFTGIICKGDLGKHLLEVAAIEYENSTHSISVQNGLNAKICAFINRVVKATEVFEVHKDSEGDWFALVRVETNNDSAFYTFFWAEFTEHGSQSVSSKSFIYARETV